MGAPYIYIYDISRLRVKLQYVIEHQSHYNGALDFENIHKFKYSQLRAGGQAALTFIPCCTKNSLKND
jgi:hypothetical protein